MSIIIPPLRERAAEIVPLAGSSSQAIASKLGRPAPRITDAAIALLRGVHVARQRARAAQRDRARDGARRPADTIDTRDLPEDAHARSRSTPAAVAHGSPGPDRAHRRAPRSRQRERQRILDALETCAGNQTHAANLLGISRRTLVNKLDKFALPRPRKK